VTGLDGRRHHPYAVHRHVDGNGLALVVSNFARHRAMSARAGFDDRNEGPRRCRPVDDARWCDGPGEIKLPPLSAAVVIFGGADA
jgi:hypothetical protein